MTRNQKILQEVVCCAGDLREICCLCPTPQALQPLLQCLHWGADCLLPGPAPKQHSSATSEHTDVKTSKLVEKDVKSFFWSFCTLSQALPLSQTCLPAVWWLFGIQISVMNYSHQCHLQSSPFLFRVILGYLTFLVQHCLVPHEPYL